jgi:hypothetical protein
MPGWPAVPWGVDPMSRPPAVWSLPQAVRASTKASAAVGRARVCRARIKALPSQKFLCEPKARRTWLPAGIPAPETGPTTPLIGSGFSEDSMKKVPIRRGQPGVPVAASRALRHPALGSFLIRMLVGLNDPHEAHLADRAVSMLGNVVPALR